MESQERIWVIGHGAVTCLGGTMDATWSGLIAGRSGLRRHESLDPARFLQNIVGMATGFGSNDAGEDPAAAKLEARVIHLALASARAAWADSKLDARKDDVDPDRVAVVVGSALGGMDLLEKESQRMLKRANPAVSPYLIPGLIINQPAGQIAQHLQLLGPSLAPANACASGGHAVILGALLLRSGLSDFALCGASESAFTPPIINGFATMKALLGKKAEDRSNADPTLASRPFSADRAGFVLSEGAGMIVLATDRAVKRLGLTPQAELLGFALNSDGYHMAMPNQARIEKCLASSLENARLKPEDIDYYNAHGTSTKVNDQVETAVLKAVFGESVRRLAVSSVKGALGHSLGAASAIEAAVCVRALTERIAPPTINYVPDPDLDLDYVPNTARPMTIRKTMSASFGFGGTNNVLIFGSATDG